MPTSRDGPATIQRPIVGVSACLLGEPVRYDGDHKRQPLLIEQLSPWLTLTGLCPEVAAGLGVPRPPVQLVKSSSEHTTKALGAEIKTLDVTERLVQASTQIVQQFEDSNPACGFILKSRSPSCGLGSTPVHNTQRQEIGLGSGLFAEQLQHRIPERACVEESWLTSPARCRQFIVACYLSHFVLQQDYNQPLLEMLGLGGGNAKRSLGGVIASLLCSKHDAKLNQLFAQLSVACI